MNIIIIIMTSYKCQNFNIFGLILNLCLAFICSFLSNRTYTSLSSCFRVFSSYFYMHEETILMQSISVLYRNPLWMEQSVQCCEWKWKCVQCNIVISTAPSLSWVWCPGASHLSDRWLFSHLLYKKCAFMTLIRVHGSP